LLSELAIVYQRLAGIQGDSRQANLGDARGAIQSYRKAAELLASAVTVEPADVMLLAALADAYRQLADALMSDDEIDAGEGELQRAFDLIQPLAVRFPANDDVRFKMAKVYDSFAFVSRARGKPMLALDYYRQAFAIYAKLLKATPESEILQHETAFAHKHMGATLAKEGRWEEALTHFGASLEIDEALLLLDPNNPDKRLGITFTYSDTGYTLIQKGELDDGIAYHRKALAIREALVAADSRNVRARNTLSHTLAALGNAYFRKGEFAAAVDWHTRSLQIREATLRLSPANRALQSDIAASQWSIGWNYAALGVRAKSPRSAAGFCRQSLHWNRLSLAAYRRLNTGERIWATDEILKPIERQIADCERIVAKSPLTASP
jgi:tetratricopeptide (TPR) repeat protein